MSNSYLMIFRLLVLVCVLPLSLQAQYEDIRMEDYIYVTNIKTATLSPIGNTLEPPITYLNNGVRLRLTFDDLDADQKDFTYDIIHCDRNWEPSNLLKQEYIVGFVNEEVDNWKFSTGTYVSYTHYYIDLPNRDLDFAISGNYVLVVYDGEEDEDRIPVLTRRFVVVDNQLRLEAKARRPLDVSKLWTHQEMDLSLYTDDYPIIDAMINLQVSVIQNGNWNTSIDTLRPRFAQGDKIIVDNTGKISFPALKEFRSLDIRSFDILSADIHSVELKEDGTDVLVQLGHPRANGGYSAYPDADGSFVIDTKDQQIGSTQSDYGNVIFTLLHEKIDEDIYLQGKFTDWQVDDLYKMRYDELRELYFAEVELKQGFYDYMFAVDNDGVLDPVPIEGSNYQTQNYYQAFVYVKEPGDRYDRVIGYGKLVPSFF